MKYFLLKTLFLGIFITCSLQARGAFVEPSTQASNLNTLTITDQSISLSWTRGNGAGVLIVARAMSTTNVTPTDNTSYTADAAFGSGSITGTGNFVVYNGTGTSVTVTGLTALETYHFYAYEYNAMGSPNPDYLLTGAPTVSATTTCTEPTTQPTSISFGSVTDVSMDVSWTGGDGNQSLVVAKAGSAVDQNPVIGVSYSASATFGMGDDLGGGNFIVYSGNGNNVSITGLSENTTYHYAIYEFNTAGNCYLITSPRTGSQQTDCTAPSQQVTAVNFSLIGDNGMTIGWTGGNGSNTLVIAKQGSAVDAAPVIGMDYTANSTFGSGSELGTGNYVVYKSSGSSFVLSGLTALTTYHLAIYEFNTGTFCYQLVGPYTASQTTACTTPGNNPSAINFGSITDAQMDVSWTGGDGDGTLVLAHAGSAVDAPPVIGMGYTANAAFGSGSQIGTGNYVVYAGSGSMVTVTGLTGSTTYHYALYEYNSTGNCYLLASPRLGNQATDCTPPGGQASAIIFSNTNAGSMQINWTRGAPSGDGVIVIVRANNPVSLTPTNGSDYAGDANSDYSLATSFSGNRIVLRGNASSVTVTELSPNTTYHFAIYEYNNTGDCYNLVSPATASNTTTGVDSNSTITNGTSSSNTISSLTNAGGPAQVLSFQVNDMGGDGRDTDMTAMTFTEVGGEITDLTQLIAGAQLGDGSNFKTSDVTINTNSITITNIPTNNALGDVNDGASKTYTLSIWFYDAFGGSLPTTVDGKRLVFSIDAADITTDPADSQFAGAQSATSDDISAPNNEITVVATELAFLQQPSNTFILSSMTPAVTVEATDARGNRDLNYTGTVDLSSTGTLQSTPSVAFVNGLGTYSTIIHTVAQTSRTLSSTNSSPALTEAGPSNTFDITGPANSSDIITDGAFSYATNIGYTNYQENTNIAISGTSLELGGFTLRDGGAGSDGDVFPTILTSIELTITNPSFIRRVALYGDLDDNGSYETELAEATPVGSTVTFNGLTLTAPSNGSVDFALRGSFTTTVTDNAQFSFQVSNVTNDLLNSGFAAINAGGAITSTAGDNNRIEVTAIQQQFTTQPDPLERQGVPITPQPVLIATDGNGIQDVDYAGAVTVTNAGGLPTTNLPTGYTAGTLTFSGFTYNAEGNGTLTVASGALANGVSNAVFVDGTAPTVVLNDDHPDNIVRDADIVTITVNFTENDQIDETSPPTISIGSVVTNAAMVKSTNLIWTYTWNVPSGNDGADAVVINATDRAGNPVGAISSGTGPTSYTIDNTNPFVTSITRLNPSPTTATSVQFQVQFDGNVNGVDASDFTPDFGFVSGVSGSGSTYSVTVSGLDGLTVVLGLDVIASGATINDVAGNALTANFTSGETYEIDNTPPQITTLSPQDDSFNNPVSSNLVITFNENISLSGSPAFISLFRSSDNALIENFDISSSPQISFNGTNQLTINPTFDLAQGTAYYVNIEVNALSDVAGNLYAGIADATTWNFTTFAPPQVTSVSAFGCVGDNIIITGQFLTGITTVRFNGVGGTVTTSFTIDTDNQITALVPTYTNPISSLTGTLYLQKIGGGNPTVDLTTTQIVEVGPSQAVLSVGTIDNDPVCSSGTTQTSTIKVDIRGGTGPFTVNYALGSISSYTSGADIVINPPSAGTNNYSLVSVTDANGCNVPMGQLTGTYSVTENERPVVEAGGNVSGQLAYCPAADGATITLNASTLGTGPSFSGSSGIVWSTNGDGTFNNTTNLNAQYTIGTNDLINNNVILTLTTTGNPTACDQVSDALLISFVGNATADPGGQGGVLEYCWDGNSPTNVQLNGTTSGGSSPSWSVVGGDGFFDNPLINNPIYTFGPNDILAQQATVRLTPTGGSCGTGSATDLTINLIPIPTNSYLSPIEDVTCVNETSVLYKVANNPGSTYNWTVPSTGGTSFVGDGTSTILVNWGSISGNYNIEVIETDNNGCQSNPIVLPVSVNDGPSVIFDPQLNQPQGSDIKYRLVLYEPTYPADTIFIDDGTLGVPPYTDFYSNDGGVIRENGQWFFDSKDLELGDYEVFYTYYGTDGCPVGGSAIFSVIDPSSQIGNLDTEYCEDEGSTLPLDPAIPGGHELRFMSISTVDLDPNGNVSRYFPLIPSLTSNGLGFEAEDLGLINTGTQPADPDYFNYPTSLPNGNFIFDPARAALVIPSDKQSITFTVTYWYAPIGDAFNLQSNTQRTTVYRAPEPRPIIENNVRVVCADDGSYALTSGNDLSSNSFNNFSFTTSAGANVIQFDGVNYTFHPDQYVNTNALDTVEILYTYNQALNDEGTKYCTVSRILKIGVFGKPPRPMVNGDDVGPISVCIIGNETPVVEATGLDATTVPGGVGFAWYETASATGTPITTGPTLSQGILNTVVGFEDFYVVQVFLGNGCISQPVRVNVERIDSFDFSVNNSCLDPSTPISFTKTTGTTSLSGIRWKVNGNVESTQLAPNIVDDFQFQFNTPGLYEVSLEITSQNGCVDELTKPVVVTPQEVAQNADVYFENFESGTGGWVATGVNSTWANGTPGSGNTTITLGSNNGSGVWMTGLDSSYEQAEESYLYSPCFDFAGLDRPMIAFDSWTHTIDKLDGVVLQYSTTGINGPWQLLGNFDNEQQSGIDWYDQRDISSNPGNQTVGFYGWSGEKTGWVNSKHRLDVIPLVERNNVIFRFAFKSSAGAQTKLDGFAIDNVFIGNRTRVVLVENFTNTGQPQNTLNESNFLKNFSFGSSELVKIHYHTGFPGSDPMNADNTAVASARALYYGISNVPRARLDGTKRDDIGTLFSEWGETEYNIRSLNNAPFDINVTTTVNNSALEINASLKALVDIAPNAVVHVVVVEKLITLDELGVSAGDIISGETDFQYVVKQMLPFASGTKFGNQVLQGETLTLNLSWIPQIEIYDPNDVAIVVFVQDELTREIYQSNLTDNITLPSIITGIDQEIASESLTIYPNPAHDNLTIRIANDRQFQTLNVYDSFGKKVFTHKIEPGDQQIQVNTIYFSSGLYHVQIEGEDHNPIRKRVMVIHK